MLLLNNLVLILSSNSSWSQSCYCFSYRRLACCWCFLCRQFLLLFSLYNNIILLCIHKCQFCKSKPALLFTHSVTTIVTITIYQSHRKIHHLRRHIPNKYTKLLYRISLKTLNRTRFKPLVSEIALCYLCDFVVVDLYLYYTRV